MRMLRRLFVILFGLLVALALLIAAGWWWLNSYIHSPAFAEQVKKESTRLTGAPVDFQTIVWELGRGITLNQLDLHNGTTPPAMGQFKADQIILKYDWQSLLDRRFEITRLTIKQPSVIIGQDAQGNLVLPVAAPKSDAGATTKPSSTPAPADKSSPLEIQWRAFNLEKGTVEVKNNDGSTRLQCGGIEVEATSVPGEKPGMKGVLTIAEISLLQKIKITGARSPMSLVGDTFSLGAIEADAYGGRLTGAWEQDFADPTKAYNLKLNLADCDVSALLSGVLQKTGVLSGRLDARTLWLGPATDPMAISGKGTAELRNGQLIQVPFFQTLSQLLNVPALSQPDFADCKIEYTVADQVVSVTSSQLKSALFELSGTGTVGFDSSLKMECRLDLSPELVKQLPSTIQGGLEKRDNGYSSVPFKLGGTISQPKVELVLTQGMVQQAVDVLKGLFGPKKDKDRPQPAPQSDPLTVPAPPAETPSTAPTTTTSTPDVPASAPAM